MWERHGELQRTSHFPTTLSTLFHPQHTFSHLPQHFLTPPHLPLPTPHFPVTPHLPPHFSTPQHTFPHLPQHFTPPHTPTYFSTPPPTLFHTHPSPLTPQHTFPHLYQHFPRPPAPAPTHFPVLLPTFFHTSPNTSLISNISLHSPPTSLYTSAHLNTFSHTLRFLPHP